MPCSLRNPSGESFPATSSEQLSRDTDTRLLLFSNRPRPHPSDWLLSYATHNSASMPQGSRNLCPVASTFHRIAPGNPDACMPARVRLLRRGILCTGLGTYPSFCRIIEPRCPRAELADCLLHARLLSTSIHSLRRSQDSCIMFNTLETDSANPGDQLYVPLAFSSVPDFKLQTASLYSITSKDQASHRRLIYMFPSRRQPFE